MTFRIFPERGLVYVRYEGFADLDGTAEAFAAYAAHPDFRPGQRQLVDLSGVTGFDRDFVKLIRLQAQKAGEFGTGATQTLIVYYAPTAESREMAALIQRSWAHIPSVVTRVQETEAGTLEVLGEPERSFAELTKRPA
ncbi:hypothetical protein [Wenxinia marina]|nr:hypothetical protein [Wenxinia marina]